MERCFTNTSILLPLYFYQRATPPPPLPTTPFLFYSIHTYIPHTSPFRPLWLAVAGSRLTGRGHGWLPACWGVLDAWGDNIERVWPHFYRPKPPPPPSPQRPGGVLAPSLGTHCELDPKSGGGESRDRRAVTVPYP